MPSPEQRIAPAWSAAHAPTVESIRREMAGTGFNIVFGGTEFHPDEFLQGSQLPWHIYKGTSLSDGRIVDDYSVQLDDFHPGAYPLNMVREALELLRTEREELRRLSKFPGITWGVLQFFGDTESRGFRFEAEDIALLHELGLSVSIYVHVDPQPPA